MGVSVSKMMCHRRIKCLDDDVDASDPPDLEKQEFPTVTTAEAIGFPIADNKVEEIEVNPYRNIGTKRATVIACIWDDTKELQINQRIHARSNLLDVTKTWVEMV
jgi:hypothetical protein